MATSTEKQSAPKSRILLFSLLALGLAGGAGGAYYFLSLKSAGTEAVAKVEVPIFMALEPFTVNLRPNGRNRFLHIAMTLKMTDPKLQAQVTQYLPEVRSRVLTVLSNREGDTLATPEDKAKLSSEIMEALNLPFAASLPPQKIASVMFTTFMLQ
jgi:flagellar FliL protein